MAGIREIRNTVREVPETVERARESLVKLDGGIQRANTVMLLLGIVAVAALGVATVALLRARVVPIRTGAIR